MLVGVRSSWWCLLLSDVDSSETLDLELVVLVNVFSLL